MPTLSLCMIVKNEEEYIRAALESVKDVADEIIIVDTGSEDHTMEICSRYTDKIYETAWTEDFSKARNFSISKAACDWILWMDADERLVIKDRNIFKKLLKSKDYDAYFIKLLHSMDSEKEEKKENYISYHNRLFRRKADFHFEGSIHEKLLGESGIIQESGNAGKSVEIIHYGYGEKHMKEKALRNLQICLKEKEKETDNPWLDYYMAGELYRLGDIKDSLEFVNHAILGFLSQSKMPPALLYKLKYDILIINGNMESVCEGLGKAVNLYDDYVELHFYRGIALFKLNRYEEARKEFSYCILLGEENANYLIRCGSGSFLAYYYMGEAYLMAGDKESACEAYEQVLCYKPDFTEAKERLEELRS